MDNVIDIQEKIKDRKKNQLKNSAINQIKKLDSIFNDLNKCLKLLEKHQRLLAVNRIMVAIQKTKNEITDIQRTIASQANEAIREIEHENNDSQ